LYGRELFDLDSGTSVYDYACLIRSFIVVDRDTGNKEFMLRRSSCLAMLEASKK
jgi:hypothetical protein